ncbi:hypothetical protein [Puniceibacterium sediminis]|uniref:Uncharacterized protein n=1 Tax=Puniceibacterium sediminis TaxID=1608407 RepID=A0A238X7D7_9RHOB|nr:hypothetical protein [Puniceibacterium sediminis]SNR54463.1 hypothetical protein SAMN06265370_109117 [Puniceibacterium sediminis]
MREIVPAVDLHVDINGVLTERDGEWAALSGHCCATHCRAMGGPKRSLWSRAHIETDEEALGVRAGTGPQAFQHVVVGGRRPLWGFVAFLPKKAMKSRAHMRREWEP